MPKVNLDSLPLGESITVKDCVFFKILNTGVGTIEIKVNDGPSISIEPNNVPLEIYSSIYPAKIDVKAKYDTVTTGQGVCFIGEITC